MTLSITELLLLLLSLLATGGLVLLARPPQCLLQLAGVAAQPNPIDRLAAEQRATVLLQQLLDPDTYARLQARGFLDLPSPTIPGRIYRIPLVAGMVDVWDDRLLTMRLCVVPTRWLPDQDIVIMHKLFIEGDEERYLRIANRYPSGTTRMIDSEQWAATRKPGVRSTR